MTANPSHSEHKPSTESILEFLKGIALEELELSEEQIQRMDLNTHLLEGLQLDSVTQVVLLTAIEDHYGFEFEFEDGERLQTVRDLVESIQARVSVRETPKH
jgi:acyl carrier protein